jgi:cytochrome c oxidase assembly factor CtaG
VKWSTWAWSPGIVLPLAAGLLLYARGLRLLWDEHVGRGIRTWEAGSFALGWLLAALALLSPLHALSEQLFSAHMVQHELLTVIAAPLLVLGRPLVAMLWAFPSPARRRIGIASRRREVRMVWGVLTRPVAAFFLHAAAIWLWHAPRLFEATLQSDAVHATQHASFLGTALLFWWTIIHANAAGGRARSIGFGGAVLLLFGTTMHSGALGALLTFSRALWYPAYASTAASWGLTPLQDQQLAGLIMWIPASLAYLLAALLLFASWLHASEQGVREAERLRDAERVRTLGGGGWS